MKTVEVSEQVAEFIRTLTPEPRIMLRAALRKLSRELGDIKALESPLDRYLRLRVAGYRVIFAYSKDGKRIQCIYADRRGVVYEVFAQMLKSELLGGGEPEGPASAQPD